MRNILSKALEFIKENSGISYSLVLVILIPAAFFINTYLTNSNYEDDIDKITYTKAIMMENIINNLIQNQTTDDQALQTSVNQVMKQNSMITSLSILKPDSDNVFHVVASSDSSLVGQEQNDHIQYFTAWQRPEEPIVFQGGDDNGRYWNITKILFDSSEKKAGLISMVYSIQDSDALINQTIRNSYWILIITVLIVVLLVSNQARLFGYVLTLSKLKEIDKMKDMFISMASHELRSPLTAIRGYVELLKEKKEVVSDQDSSHYITNISTSVDRLNTLVNDILEVSRIEGNRLPINITTFDPAPIIISSIEEMKSQALQKGLTLNYQPSEEKYAIKADTDRLKQVLVNLVSNSIKYTEKGSVDVSTSIKDNQFLVTIADTGIGISAEDQTNLFQKFYRVQNEKTSGIIGTGLGLWITSELVRRMDGHITVESIEGVGSHFTVHLPIAKS